jgi:hypothetical protein
MNAPPKSADVPKRLLTKQHLSRLRDKLRIVIDGLPHEDTRALRDAIWILSDVCSDILDEMENDL